MKNYIACSAVVLLVMGQSAQAQSQLLCDAEQRCSITCYQDGMDNAEEIFHRKEIDTLQVDVNGRLLKIELRGQPSKPPAFDYFILGSEMSCTIDNMRGVHDQ